MKIFWHLENYRRKEKRTVQINYALIGGKRKSQDKLNDEKNSKQRKGSHRVKNAKTFFRYSLSENSSISVKDLPHKV